MELLGPEGLLGQMTKAVLERWSCPSSVDTRFLDVEAHLHRRLAAWLVRGEWYAREPLLASAEAAGGWEPYLHSLLPAGIWEIATYGPDDTCQQTGSTR